MMKKYCFIAVLLVLTLISVSKPESRDLDTAEAEDIEIAGWLKSGKDYHVLPDTSAARYQGGSFSRFAPSFEVRSLFSLNDTLWVGTEGGLYTWDRSNDSLAFMDRFPFTSVRVIAVDDFDRIWVGCEEGLAMRDLRWRFYTPEVNPFFENIRDLSTGNRKIWIATYGNGCGYISGDSLTVISEDDSLLDDRVTSVVEETPSRIWFGTASGVCRADSFRWQPMRYGSGIPIGEVNDLIFDEERNLFIAVKRQGVSRFKFGSVKNYPGDRGLPGWNINQFGLTLTGELIAAGKGGLSYFDGSGWTPYRLSGVPLHRYHFISIHHDISDNSFIGTNEGKVIVAERDGVREISLPVSFPASRVVEITGTGEKVYMITEKGIFAGGDEIMRVGLPDSCYSKDVTGIAESENRDIWVCTRFGILRFSKEKWEIFDRRNGLPTEYITCAASTRRGDLWFGTFDSGLLRFSNDRWYHYTRDSGLPDDRISKVLVDGEERLWVLTASGRTAYYQKGEWRDSGLRVEREKASPAGGEESGSDPEDIPGLSYLSSTGKDMVESEIGVTLGVSSSGNCIIARREGIYIHYDSEWTRVSPPEGNIIPTAVLMTRRSEILLGTRDRGLYIMKEGRWIELGSLSGMPARHIRAIYEDEAGIVYIGTAFSGFWRFVYSGDR